MITEPIDVEPEELIRRALDVRERAYAPYSRHAVGCAVLVPGGNVYVGCNVENASYGLTVCAERAALVAAVANGHRKIEAVAVVSGPGSKMCGGCRQVLAEFADTDTRILLGDEAGAFRERRIKELLPGGFP
jgi:cytidine deaminase